jgi:hypothetical protein
MKMVSGAVSVKNVRTHDSEGEVPKTRLHVNMGLLEHTYSHKFKGNYRQWK